MKKAAPISVVIPAHNAEPFLAEAIRSVKKQSLKVAETIVIADDCSDRTAQIAAGLGAKVIEQTRRNMAAGLNLGVRHATQPWIAFLDSDDYWAKDKIASQWKAIQTFPEAAMVSCDTLTLMDGNVNARSRRYLQERWQSIAHTKGVADCRYIAQVEGRFMIEFFITTSTVMLRRDVFSQLGEFDESLLFGQTLEFFARVLARFSIAFVERPLLYRRIHAGCLTMDLAGYWPTYLSIVERILKNPDQYPPGAGDAFRQRAKEWFHQSERHLARAAVG